MNRSPIYTITTIRASLMGGSRSPGFYHELEEAKSTLVNNDLDINEMGYYPYAVIEMVNPGLYTVPRTELWYKWNHEKDSYEPCEKPERFKKTCAWSLG
jgi:hypothetical protein